MLGQLHGILLQRRKQAVSEDFNSLTAEAVTKRKSMSCIVEASCVAHFW